MIIMLSASAIYLAGLQAAINAPRDAFRDCLTSAAAKAATEKVGADVYGDYLRTNCSTQIDAYKAASVRFDVKNGISRKEAASLAEEMITSELGGPIDKYKLIASRSGASKPTAPAVAAAAPAQPAEPAQPAQ